MPDYADLAEYVERAKTQDEAAFTHLYEKTCLMVYNIACTVLRDEEEAKDVVSEVYIRVWKHLTSLRDNRSFIRWLIVITQHVCQDHKTKWQQLPDSTGTLDELEEPDDLISEWEQKETLRSLMQSLIHHLPETQQRAIYCVYFRQLSVAQTAALEDCSVNTILSRLYYARNTLRRAILEEEKRTGDKYHLPVAAAALSALMALSQQCFTLSPEEAARILVSVFTALGVQYTGEKAPPIITVITEDDLGKHRSILIKFKPVLIGVLAAAGLLLAMLLLGLGYAHGRRAQTPGTPTTPPAVTTEIPSHTTADYATTSEPETTAAPVTTAEPETTAAPITTAKPETTAAPVTTAEPETTAAPITTAKPETTAAPVTTAKPETTAAPVTTAVPETTAAPVTTAPAPQTAPTGPQTALFSGMIYTYTVQNSSATITAAELDADTDTATMESLVIPASLDGWPVTAIGEHTFNSNPDLRSLYLPEGLETIGQYAFYSCKSLTAISFPHSLQNIDQYAFACCENLPEIKLAEGLETIGKMAFSRCYALREVSLPESLTYMDALVFGYDDQISSIHLPSALQPDLMADPALARMAGLREITVSPDNPYLCAVDGVLYSKDMRTLVLYPADKPDAHYTVPPTVTRIGNYGLPGNHMASITLPEGLQKIGGWCFSSNSSLRQITVPANVSYIGVNAFSAPNLEEIIVLQGNQHFCAENGVLYDRKKTSLLCYPMGKTDLTYTVPNTVTTFAPYAIYQNPHITGISMGDSVKKIDVHSISTLPALTSLRLSDNIGELPSYAIQGNVSITEYVMPKNLSSIAQSALQACTNLTRVVFQGDAISYSTSLKIALRNQNCVFAYPRNATGWSAAYWTDNYNMQPYDPDETEEKAEAPKPSASQSSTQASGTYQDLFYTVEAGCAVITGCRSGVTELRIPAKIQGYPVTQIAKDAFSANPDLVCVDLPEGLTTIGSYAFNMCKNLRTVYLPGTLTSIESRAFYSCALEEIVFPESNLKLGVNAFGQCNQLRDIHLPAGISFSTVEYSWQPFTNLSNLQSFTVSPDNPNFCAEDGVLFTKNMEHLICYPRQKPGSSYVIPDGVKTLGMHAFYASKLSSVSIPDSVTEIYDFCFLQNDGLTSLSLPANLKRIGDSALNGHSLTSIDISDDNPFFSVRDGILFDKNQTVLYTYPAAKPDTEYTVDDTVLKLMRGAFSYSKNLIHVSIPSSVVYTGIDCFRYAKNLQSVHFNGNLATFEGRMFQGCLHLSELKFGGGVPKQNELSLFKPAPSLIIYYPSSHPEWETSWANKYTLVPYDAP